MHFNNLLVSRFLIRWNSLGLVRKKRVIGCRVQTCSSRFDQKCKKGWDCDGRGFPMSKLLKLFAKYDVWYVQFNTYSFEEADMCYGNNLWNIANRTKKSIIFMLVVFFRVKHKLGAMSGRHCAPCSVSVSMFASLMPQCNTQPWPLLFVS